MPRQNHLSRANALPISSAMRYGYFDDSRAEYVIERQDTPQPWSNYLGDRKYGAIITNNGAGYSFTQSPAMGRILQYSYVTPMCQQPARTYYLREAGEGGELWSNTWLPCAKPLDEYAATCRVGMGYMEMESRYREIGMKTTYFIPRDQLFEYWILEVRNEGNRSRELEITSFAEFNKEWHILHDTFNRQYSDFIVRSQWVEGMASASSCMNLAQDKENFSNRDQSRWWYLCMGGDAVPESYELNRDSFLGTHGGYANPQSLAGGGELSGSEAYGDVACSAQKCRLTLGAGEAKTLIVILGVGKAEEEGVRVRTDFLNARRAWEEFGKLKAYWTDLMKVLKVETPDSAFNSMVNVWNAYNALQTFEWSRACNLVYSGIDRDGFGYRDTVQDIVGITSMIPEKARERLLLMISGQESKGGAQPVVDPVFFKPGKMPAVNPASQRSDDCLWLFNAVPAYVAESGDEAFYDAVAPYADGGEDTVFQHLRRALEFNLERLGAHGLPCGLKADWNDCIELGFHGETVFVTFQLRLGLAVFAGLAKKRGAETDEHWATEKLAELDKNIQAHTWDGEWFVRAYHEDGSVFGSQTNEEGQIFLNPQSWSVISGAASAEQGSTAMDSVEDRLAGQFGVAVCDPPYKKTDPSVMRAVLFLPGVKENGSIFSHTQGWAVIADCILGQGDRAYKNLRAYMPAAQNDFADHREIEPYVHCQSTHGPASEKSGMSRVPWLSGTVAWTYYTMTQYILGIRPEVEGLRIDPCIPSGWESFTAKRIFRGKKLEISVKNPEFKNRGVSSLDLEWPDGTAKTIEGNLVPADHLQDGLRVSATISG